MNKDFSRQNLRGRSFIGHDLRGDKFDHADLRGTNFKNANIEGVSFEDAQCGLRLHSRILFSFIAVVFSLGVSLFVLVIFPLIASASAINDVIKEHVSFIILYSLLFATILTIRPQFGIESGVKLGLYTILVILLFGMVASIIDYLVNNISVTRFLSTTFIVGMIGAFSGVLGMLAIVSGAFCIVLGLAANRKRWKGILCSLIPISYMLLVAIFRGPTEMQEVTSVELPELNLTYFASAILMAISYFVGWQTFKGNGRNQFILSTVVSVLSRWGTSFHHANLSNSNFSYALLENTDFRSTNLFHTRWYKAQNILLARFQNTVLDDILIRKLLVDGISNTKSFRGKNLQETNLSNLQLEDFDLTDTNLINADLSNTSLKNVKLIRAQAIGAIFTNADLTGACIEGWNIDHRTKFDGVTCRYIYLLNENLERRPRIGEFSKNQFSQLFEKVSYTTNLILGMKGIDQIPKYFNEALKYDSCFISYSSKDEDFVRKLYQDLEDNNVTCWFAPASLKIGDKLRSTIDEKILNHDKVLIILSENSVRSDWVEHEIETAFDKEIQQGHPVLFPIKIDDSVMSANVGWAAKIRRERHIGDFREWRNNSKYQEAFKRLLGDLNQLNA